MRLLAIDTAANICAVCVWDTDADKSVASMSIDLGRGHAERLLPLIAETLNSANIDMAAIDKIAVSVGPGSFTGIRVGVAAARGFGVALAIPVVGITTFDAISFSAKALKIAKDGYAVALQGGRGQAFVQRYTSDGLANGAPEIIHLDQISSSSVMPEIKSIFGNAAALIDPQRAVLDFEVATADIEFIARLGVTSKIEARPVYVRSADAKIQEGFALPRSEANLP